MTEDEAMVEAAVVRMSLDWAYKRDALPIWTVYDHPKDFPDGFVARLHLVEKSGEAATDQTIECDLEQLRWIFERVGLVMIPRSLQDDSKIVESWL